MKFSKPDVFRQLKSSFDRPKKFDGGGRSSKEWTTMYLDKNVVQVLHSGTPRRYSLRLLV